MHLARCRARGVYLIPGVSGQVRCSDSKVKICKMLVRMEEAGQERGGAKPEGSWQNPGRAGETDPRGSSVPAPGGTLDLHTPPCQGAVSLCLRVDDGSGAGGEEVFPALHKDRQNSGDAHGSLSIITRN